MAAGGDVSQIMLQMPNAVAQLVIDPLLQRGVLFFKRGVRGDVLGYFCGPKDFFREKIKAGGKQGGVNMRLQMKARSRLKENSLLNGALLWSAVFLDGLFAFVRHGFGVFPAEAGREDVK
jgi:hypothetical protein